MSDLTLTQLKKAYDSALEQTAAESFLGKGMLPGLIIDRLQIGNNPPGSAPSAPILDGKLRMTLEQAQAFESRYIIIDTYQNDATGFSAVALRDTDNPNRVVIAVRSTEINTDRARDVGADFQIFTSGFAFDQILSAQDFLARVQPQLLSGEKIDLVGYSLSGNIVRTLAAMYPTEVNQTSGMNVVFNATGLGGFSDPTGQNRSRSVVLLEMMNLYRQVEENPNSATDVPLLLQPLQLTAIAAPPLNRTDPNGNVYPSPRNDFAEAYVQNKYTIFYNDFGTTVAEPSFAQYFGVALSGFDATTVANSGSHPVPVGIPIEGQPIVAIPGVASRLEYLNTHSLTLIADSLRLQVLFKEIDPNLSMDDIQTIFQASSASSANTLLERAEKDTLENTLDAVRKTLLPIDPIFQPTPSSEAAGGFGLISNRTVFHTNITAVENVLSQVVPGTYRIESLVNRPLEEVKGNALLEDVDGKGLAYRYALQELNPFAIIGPMYAQHNPNAELALFNPDTGLGTVTTDYIPDRGLFLAAKVALNQTNLDLPLNPFTLTHYHDNTTGYDIPSGLSIPPPTERKYIFGNNNAETIVGGVVSNDHLYGGDGVDTLLGNGGGDYLQGDDGNDTINGGLGADRMAGGRGDDIYIVANLGDQVLEGFNNGNDTVESSVTFAFVIGDNLEDLTLTGNDDLNGTGNDLNNTVTGNSGINRLDGKGGTDHLIGGIGNDILTGGTGNNDRLEGGAGFDTYYYNAGDGTDRIEDSDARGQIIFNGHRLLGGIHDSNDPLNTYKSLDGLTTYVLSGTDLIVNGVLTVNENFQSGQFGIQLDDLSSYPTNDGPPSGPFAYTYDGTPNSDYLLVNIPPVYGPIAIIAHGGDDLVSADSSGDGNLFDGGPGDDLIGSSHKQDYLLGGDGDDYAYIGSRDVFLGGNGNDVGYAFSVTNFVDVTRTPGQRYMDGGSGTDLLVGGLEGDMLRGGGGDDTLRGENIPAGWLARLTIDSQTGEPWQMVFEPQEVFSPTGGADVLDGGDGNDLLVGDGGDDILSGGAGNDRLFGDDEAGYLVASGDDVLDGGADDDLLAGGDGADSLSGGTGLDQLFGDKGADLLDGGNDADTLHGGDGADELFGGAGDDLLFGDGLNNPAALSTAGGVDFMDGGAGNDHLEGGIGDDTLFGGTENDVLFGDEGADSLFGDEGVDELQGGAGGDLLGGDAGDDRLFGQDGADTLYGDEGNDRLAGNDGNDTLVGGDGNDVFEGGHGNDSLIGGAGHDTYLFSLGDGHDVLTDTVSSGAGNTIQFGAGITLGTLLLTPDSVQQSLLIQIGAGGDSILLLGYDPNAFQYGVQTLAFSDGSQVGLADLLPLPSGFVSGDDAANVIRTGSGDDVIDRGAGVDSIDAGAGNDTLIGGAGNDALTGGTGDDTYVFNLGDGVDAINDSAVAGAGNSVVFGGGITPGSLTLVAGSSLQVQVGTSGDALILSSFNRNDALGPHAIDRFQFADGTTCSYAQLLGLGFDIDGTENGEFIAGTSLNDRINGRGGPDSIEGNAGDDTIDAGTGDDSVDAGDGNDSVLGGDGNDFLRGGAGNDTLLGGEGNDTLRGGSGNDQLFGGAGDDVMFGEGGTDIVDGGLGNDRLIGVPGTYTYMFGTGSGQDIIDSSQGGTYTIQMSADVLPNDVIVGRVDQTITLNLSGGLDTLTLPSFYVNLALQVQFGDGTVWDSNAIHNQAGDSRQVGTSEQDGLSGYKGFPDELIGLAGDDVYGVNDLGDVVVEAPNEGHDTVYSTVDFTLPDNVEGLLLRDPYVLYDPIGSVVLHADPPALLATGNALNNVLSGNSYDNVITGGAGDDTLDGGFAYRGGTLSTSDDDILDGGSGNDTYSYGPWSGVDTILDDSSMGDVNRVEASIASVGSNLSLALKGNALTLVFIGQDDSSALEQTHELRIPNFDPNDAYGRHAIDLFTFSDYFTGIDTTLTYSQLIDRGIDVQGTSQDDILGTNAANRFHGGGGNDTLNGGMRNDIYFFDRGDGVDTIVDTAMAGAMNEIRFGSGLNLGDLEVVQGANSLTILAGSNGDAILLSNFDPTGQAGSSVIGSVTFTNGIHLSLDELLNFSGGTEGNDTFAGTGGPDGYNGRGGNDVIIGGGGKDLLLGGSGQDHLKGEAGDDQLFGGSGNDQLDGGSGADELGGGYGNDTLTGGIGDDLLDGGAGTDVYVFNRGDGYDTIRDRAESGESNRLLFGPGITPSDLSFVPVDLYSTMVQRINIVLDSVEATVEQIILPNVANAPAGLRTISFADGLTLDLFNYYAASLVQADQNLFAGAGDDTLIGGVGNDTLHGGAGNSVLIGGTGNNTLFGGTGQTTFYSQSAANNVVVFGSGSNLLVIPGGSSRNTVSIPQVVTLASNTVVFGGGYDSFDPLLGFGSLLIRYGSEGGELHIEGFDPNDAYANPGIGTFQFTDRTLTYQQLIDLGFDISGNDEGNVLTGSSATDRIKGLGGNDTLQSGLGADVLEGGQGDDLLSGGMGDDTYVFNAGNGIDTIQDVADAGEGNRIQFGTGISQSDLTFTQDQVARTLTIQAGTSGSDQLVLSNFDPTGADGSLVVETLAFADGTTASLAALLGLGGPVNHAPTVATPLADQTVAEEAPFSLVVPANTFADEDAGGLLTLSASLADGTALPAWLSFNAATVTFSGTPDDAQVGALDLRVTATDTGNLSVSDSFTLTVNNVNEGPTVAAPLANQTAVEDTAFTFVVPGATFTDVDQVHGDTLSYSAGLSGGGSLPAWLSFDPITHTLSGTPLNGHVGTLALTVMATDQGSLSASTGFTLAIQNVNDTPTVAAPLADQTTAEDSTFTLTIPSTTFADEDVIHGDVLTYNATLANGSALPAWLSFKPSTRTFSGTPVNANVGSLEVNVTAMDTGTLSASDTFGLTVTNVNDAPTVANPIVDQSAHPGGAFTLTVPTNTFADVDLGDTLTYSATLADGSVLPAWLSFNSTTRTFNGTPSNGDTGLVNIKVTATDTWSLSVSDLFGLTVTIQDQVLTGTAGSDVLTGGAGNDQLLGLAGNDTLQGGAGNDLLDGGAGTDTLQGGAGDDTYVVDNAGDVVTENLNEGVDTLQSSISSTLGANVENLTLAGTAAITGTGNALDNVLMGNSAANTLTGGTGNDTLNGGAGADTIVGGTGNDTYVVDATGDVVTEQANEGTDTVQSSVTYTLGSNVENLTLTGTANLNGTGNALDNILTGNGGINVLTGGAGNDTYVVGAGDTVAESLNGGTDTVESAITFTLGSNVENLLLTGTGNINGTGSSANNVLVGNSGNNTLDGGSGNDSVDGGDGNDSLLGGSGDDTLLGDRGNDQLNAGSGNDVLTGGDGTDTLDGGSGDDQLLGGAGNDALTGGSGADQFTGGTGNDATTGGSGNDRYNFTRGDGQDTISDSDPFQGNQDRALFGATINPLDLVVSRQTNDLRLAIHGSADQITVQNWYVGTTNRIETIQAGNGQTLPSTQVDQLIQAMAGFTQQTGLTWDQAIDQRPQDAQTVLAASWQ